jgi:ribose transport system ATP-binding protein
MRGSAGAGALLVAEDISKTYPGLRALDHVSLTVGAGEIVALVGQNGSGKSTLVKALTGVVEPDPGGGVHVRAADGTMISGALGRRRIHVIHQDLGVIAGLSTIDNIGLGRAMGRRWMSPVRRKADASKARALIAKFGAGFDVTVPVGRLTPAERTIVAMARALDRWEDPGQILLLDEPTVALHGDEVARLFSAIRRVVDDGAGVIFISHRLDEVERLADRIVVLRDGRKMSDTGAGEVDRDTLIALIAGRALQGHRERQQDPAGPPVLDVRGLTGGTVRSVDLCVRAGEIVGVSGLLGSGREHLAGLIFGAGSERCGTVRVHGQVTPAGRPDRAIGSGMAYVPADRHVDGAVMSMSARENLTLAGISQSRPWRRLNAKAERHDVDRWVSTVELSPPMPERRLELFSGGNQQKVVLAKWLRTKPRLLLLDEPTQGVDVGAKAAIYELIERAADDGCAVLVSSSDEKELAMLCSRVLVLRDGTVAKELERAELSEARLMREGLATYG